MTPEQLRQLKVLRLGFLSMIVVNVAIAAGGQVLLKRNHELEIENLQISSAAMYIVRMMEKGGFEPDEFDLIAINAIRNSKQYKKKQ